MTHSLSGEQERDDGSPTLDECDVLLDEDFEYAPLEPKATIEGVWIAKERYEALLQDARRLDWIMRDDTYCLLVSYDGTPAYDAWVEGHEPPFMASAPTFREAIDGAMALESSSPGGTES